MKSDKLSFHIKTLMHDSVDLRKLRQKPRDKTFPLHRQLKQKLDVHA
jgi:hypothetical protein